MWLQTLPVNPQLVAIGDAEVRLEFQAAPWLAVFSNAILARNVGNCSWGIRVNSGGGYALIVRGVICWGEVEGYELLMDAVLELMVEVERL